MTAIVKKPTMFELACARREIIERVIEAGGEITDADGNALSETDASIEDKSLAYLAVIGAIEAERDRANEEAEIARAYAASCNKAVDGLRSRLSQALALAQITKVKAGNRTISVCKGRASVVIDELDKLPVDGKLAKLEIIERVVPDKAAIKEAIEAGTDVPGAHITIGADTIRITTPRTKAIPATDPQHDRAISSDINAGE